MSNYKSENVITEFKMQPNGNGLYESIFTNVPNKFGFGTASNIFKDKRSDIDAIAVSRPDNVNVVSTISTNRNDALLNLTISNNEYNLLRTYRRISGNVIIEFALTEIVNASFVSNEPDKLVLDIDFYDNEAIDVLPKNLKKKIREAFFFAYRLYDFSNTSKQYFKDWYVDGKIAFEMVMDYSRGRKGLVQLNRIESERITRYEVYPYIDKATAGTYRLEDVQVAYVYRQIDKPNTVYNSTTAQARGSFISGLNNNDVVELNKDIIVYVDSGEYDYALKRNVGFLHKCLNPLYRYTLMEQSMIIFRITRAPSRLVVYVDVENASEENARIRLNDVKNSMRGSRSYDIHSEDQMSNIDNARQISPTEDIYITRNANGQTTEIDQLEGGKFEGILDETEYFLHQLKLATKVPLSRWTEESSGSFFSRVDEKLTREEERFGIHVANMVQRFVKGLFDMPIRAYLIQNNYIKPEEWDLIKSCIYYKPTESNNDIIRKRLNEQRLLADVAQNYLPLLDQNIIDRQYIAEEILRLEPEKHLNMQYNNMEYIAFYGNLLQELGYNTGVNPETINKATSDPTCGNSDEMLQDRNSNPVEDDGVKGSAKNLKGQGAIPALELTKIGTVARSEDPKYSKQYKNPTDYEDYKSDSKIKL